MTDRYHRRREAVVEQLGGCCVECGTRVDLEIDHADSTTKTFDIAKALSGWSDARIQQELSKCVLRCKAHHRRKTTLERGHIPLEEALHGTLNSYNNGCRCTPCRAANAAYKLAYKHRRKALTGG
jgi:hypothetical protein